MLELLEGLRSRTTIRNEWLGHVEHVAAEVIGRETVDHVAKIDKYYVAYKLAFEAAEARARRPLKGEAR